MNLHALTDQELISWAETEPTASPLELELLARLQRYVDTGRSLGVRNGLTPPPHYCPTCEED